MNFKSKERVIKPMSLCSFMKYKTKGAKGLKRETRISNAKSETITNLEAKHKKIKLEACTTSTSP